MKQPLQNSEIELRSNVMQTYTTIRLFNIASGYYLVVNKVPKGYLMANLAFSPL